MCFDRLTDEETVTASIGGLLAAEWRCALRNGVMAAVMVVAVLLVQGTPAWLVLWSAGGALALGTLLHQVLLLAGAGVLRARARLRGTRSQTAS